MPKKSNIFGEIDDEDVDFKINRGYADNYNKWREKEEFQKLKDRYGNNVESESSETESEDFDPEDLNPEAEKHFLSVLSALKGKDPKIYDTSNKFFNDKEEEEDVAKLKKRRSKNDKPMFLKDYERKVIVEEQGKLIDEEDECPSRINEDLPYAVQQSKLKESFKVKIEDEEDDFLKPRMKSDEEKKKEEEEFVEWLKGQKKEISEESDKKKLGTLRDYWNDPNLEEGEKFLKDYLLNKRFLTENDDDEGDDNIPSYSQIVDDDEEDEKILEAQEEFEHKYNFRFEEPDANFVKSYPRTVKDSLRRKNETKKLKRDSYKERKEKEKQQKKEEIKHLKNLKRKEIVEKLKKLKEITGRDDLPLDPDEFDKDFDPADYDNKMKHVFDEKFYSKMEENDEKPTFTPSESDETDEEALEDWQVNKPSSSSKVINAQDDVGESKKRKSSKFLEAVNRKKPVFDPNEKSFEKYFDDYYKLDYEDIIGGDTICRFKYRTVMPNDFGLTTDEILLAKPKELNAWCSIHKMSQYRAETDELYDVQAYKKKAETVSKKERILPSLFKNDNQETIVESKKKGKKKKIRPVDDSDQVSVVKNEQKTLNEIEITTKKGRKRKRKTPNQTCNPVESIPDERLKAYGLNPKKLKNKLKYKKI